MAVAVQSVQEARESFLLISQSTGLVRMPILADEDGIVTDLLNVPRYDDGRDHPAVVILERGTGRIVWYYFGQSNNDRPSNEVILSQIPDN